MDKHVRLSMDEGQVALCSHIHHSCMPRAQQPLGEGELTTPTPLKTPTALHPNTRIPSFSQLLLPFHFNLLKTMYSPSPSLPSLYLSWGATDHHPSDLLKSLCFSLLRQPFQKNQWSRQQFTFLYRFRFRFSSSHLCVSNKPKLVVLPEKEQNQIGARVDGMAGPFTEGASDL